MHSKTILIIDDDRRLHEGISDFLAPFGFSIASRYSGDDALAALDGGKPELILLDIMLPGEKDGLTLLRDIRQMAATPIIMLTARGEETDRIVGLEMGADDYLSKPFSLRELLARIKAVLRRAQSALPAGQPHKTVSPRPDDSAGGPAPADSLKEPARQDGFVLDVQRHVLRWQGRTLDLSTSEVRILEVFLGHRGEVLSRDKIQSLAFGDGYFAGDRNIDVHISRMRSQLRTLDHSLSPICTVWGAGYRWVDSGA